MEKMQESIDKDLGELKNKHGDADVENGLVDTVEEGEGGMNG